MSDIEHELRSYTDTTEPPADQDEMAELVAQLASEAHAAHVAMLDDQTEEPTTTNPNDVPF